MGGEGYTECNAQKVVTSVICLLLFSYLVVCNCLEFGWVGRRMRKYVRCKGKYVEVAPRSQFEHIRLEIELQF